MKNKTKKIFFVLLIIIFLILGIGVYNAGKRVAKYPCTKPYEELTLLEKIASKVEGYDIKTKDEMKKAEEKAIETARKEKKEKAEKEGVETAEKVLDRVKEGSFTMDQYSKVQKILMEKLKNKEITIEELNEIDRKISNGEIKIEEYLQ